MVEKDRVLQNITSFIGSYSGKKKLEGEMKRLQSHLAELEADNNRLRIQLEKCKETQRNAVYSKQIAEEALNKAESRIITLTEQLQSHTTEKENISMPVQESLNLHETSGILATLGSMRSVKHTFISMYLPQNYKMENMDRGLLQHFNENSIRIIDKLQSSTGMVVFHDMDDLIFEIILPPLPITKHHFSIDEKFYVDGLSQILKGESSVLVLIVHAGESFIGYTEDGEHLISSQVIRSSVKAKHTKGGFSQRRFERLRDEDIAHHVEKVRIAIAGLLENMITEPDYVILGGDGQLARAALENMGLKSKVIEHSLNIHIGKNDFDSILLKSLAWRRYKP
jgi:peptide subunit release factor 1 (eRF1)